MVKPSQAEKDVDQETAGFVNDRLEKGEVFWLIEMQPKDAPTMFWDGGGWQPSALEACRFRSRQYAKNAVTVLFGYGSTGALIPENIYVADHLWSDNEAAEMSDMVSVDRAALLALKRTGHDECEDCWYSCATITCDDERKSDVCDCGTDHWNARIDALIAAAPKPDVDAVERVRKAAIVVKEMLELGDIRLMAMDGPCGGQLPDLSPKEWGKVYRACKTIAKLDLAALTKAGGRG